MPSSHRQLAPVATSSLPCDHCAAYRTVGMNALQYLHKLRNQTHLHESSFDYAQRNYARRAYTYNRLYEEALLKEAKNPSASYVASGVGTVGTSVMAAGTTSTAAMAKTPDGSRSDPRLEQCPSLKWTWGVDITPDDIAKMFRAADREYALPHSGYDCSLTGSLPGQYSDKSSLPSSPNKAEFSSVGTNDEPIISDKNYINQHFHEYPLHRRLPAASEEEMNLGADDENGTDPCGSCSRWPRLLPMQQLSKAAMRSGTAIHTAVPAAISIPPSGTSTAPNVMNVLLPMQQSLKPAMQSGTTIRTQALDVMRPPSMPNPAAAISIPPSGSAIAPDVMNVEPPSATAAPPAFSALDVFHALKQHLPNLARKEEGRQQEQSATGNALQAFSLLQQKKKQETRPGTAKEVLQALRQWRDLHH
jgi:hypothetical protein